LEITKIHQVIEYTPLACFKSFQERVTEARRKGDADPSTAIIADTMKLIGKILLLLLLYIVSLFSLIIT
jgi:hypothetical protein